MLKSLAYDSESIGLSSYDLVAIAFSMSEEKLSVKKGQELLLLKHCLEHCMLLSSDQKLRESLTVPDQHRKIFCEGHATLKGLNQLVAELNTLSNDVLHENMRSFKKLEEARVEY